MPVSEKERQQINTLVARFEADTGVQAVAAVIGKADAYPEIPWKAYALGSALGALSLAIDPHLLPQWAQTHSALFHAVAILGVAAVLSLAAAFVPAIGRFLIVVVELRLELFRRQLFGRRRQLRRRRRFGKLVKRYRYAGFFSRSRKCLRNLATFGATTAWQYG